MTFTSDSGEKWDQITIGKKLGFNLIYMIIVPQELEPRDGGHCCARKGTSTTVPVMSSPTITVSPSEAACLLI